MNKSTKDAKRNNAAQQIRAVSSRSEVECFVSCIEWRGDGDEKLKL